MSQIHLSWENYNQIVDHTQRIYPQEACGLLLGNKKHVTAIVQAENIATDPYNHYAIDPVLVSKNLSNIIGFYHSHPKGEPIPSPVDLQEAWQGNTIYLIIGLKNRNSPRLAAWRIYGQRVISVEVITGDEYIEVSDNLSYSQINAILVSGMLTILLLVAIALYLLPPAPPIP